MKKVYSTVRKQTFNNLTLLERDPLRYCKCDVFTRPFLMLGKVTFDDHVNALKRYWKCDVSYTLKKNLMALFPKINGH